MWPLGGPVASDFFHTEGGAADRLATCLLPWTKGPQRLGKKHTNTAICPGVGGG